MELDIIGVVSLIIFSILDLLKLSILVAIPVLIISKITLWIRDKIYWTYGFSWLVGTYLSIFIISFVFLFVFYLLPILLSLREVFFYEGYLPPYFQISGLEILDLLLVSLFRIFFTSIFLVILLMVPAFFGSFTLELVEKYTKTKGIISLGLTVLFSSIIWSSVTVIVLPFLPLGLLYLVFFAG